MRIARLQKRPGPHKNDGRETYGFVDASGRAVSTRDDITFATGVPIPRGIKEFLFGGWYHRVAGKDVPYGSSIDDYEVMAPIPDPGKIVCLTFNYKDHASEQGLPAPPPDPDIFIKPSTSLTGTGSDIRCPDFVGKLDYEVELAVVIGTACKNVPRASAMDHVFGYMVFDDVSARDIQLQDRQFTRGKGFDDFAPCGPWITTADEIPDPHSLRLSTRVNGRVRQDSTTGMMLLWIPDIISKLSRVMTLEPGDIISTGTPAGVALKNPGVPYLEDGDVVEMEIEGLGSIRNTVRKVPSGGGSVSDVGGGGGAPQD